MEESLDLIASRVRLLLMDVDGVMTDGKSYNLVDAKGFATETKGFDSQDGIALQWLNWKGIKSGLISGRVSQATELRAKQSKMAYVYQGHIEKIPAFEEIVAKSGVPLNEIAYVADDLTDYTIMKRVGLPIAVANARPEVKQIAKFVTEARGGEGAIREVVELILKSTGQWREILAHYQVK